MFKKLKEQNDAFIAKQEAERAEALKSPEEQQKLKATLNKFGLDIDNYTKQDLDRRNIEAIQKIYKNLTGNKLIEVGMALSFSKAEEQAKVSYLGALVDQNWIIIRQNEAMLRSLEKLSLKS